MWRYTYILVVSCVFVLLANAALAQGTDSTAGKKKVHAETGNRQIAIGIDVFNPIFDYYSDNNHMGYEGYVDYYLRKEFYAVGEAGWGNASVSYPDLSYTTNNTFLRAGFNKCMLTRHSPRDWDMMFIGLRAAISNVHRSDASYVITDSLWGSVSGIYPGRDFAAFWAEVTGGMRVELWKGIFAGWNVRAKFMLNARSFRGLAPEYIAGYGRGDKNNGFDFNVYLSYGIRWKRSS
jgi:hypothetical protein